MLFSLYLPSAKNDLEVSLRTVENPQFACVIGSGVPIRLKAHPPIVGSEDENGRQKCTVTLEELIFSSLATADALTKLLIEKGLITEAEFMQKLSAERAGYQTVLPKVS